MKDIYIPNDAVKYILFQRTGYLKKNLLFIFLSIVGHLKPLYKVSVSLKAMLFRKKIKHAFVQDMEKEFMVIKDYLPTKINTILDIGCGVAGIDIFLSRYYDNNIKIFLIDKTEIDKNVYYYFKKRGSFYNSLQISREMLENSGVNKQNIMLQEANDKNEINFKNTFDIVISLISWGHHYPVSTYLDQVYNKMNKKGILILDIRKNTAGEEDIKRKFGHYHIISDNKKYNRVMAIKS